LAFFSGGKYLQRNALDRAPQVVKELALELRSQDFALSFQENGKSLNRMVTLETLLIFLLLHFSKNDEKCILGFFKGYPSNFFCLKRVMSLGLN